MSGSNLTRGVQNHQRIIVGCGSREHDVTHEEKGYRNDNPPGHLQPTRCVFPVWPYICIKHLLPWSCDAVAVSTT